jgi:hypothetical protein
MGWPGIETVPPMWEAGTNRMRQCPAIIHYILSSGPTETPSIQTNVSLAIPQQSRQFSDSILYYATMAYTHTHTPYSLCSYNPVFWTNNSRVTQSINKFNKQFKFQQVANHTIYLPAEWWLSVYHFQSRLREITETPHWQCYHNIFPTLSAAFPIIIIILIIIIIIIATIQTTVTKENLSHWWSRYTQIKNDNEM